MVLKVQEIRELIKLVDQSSLNELIYEEEGCKIKLRKSLANTTGHTVLTEATPVAPVVQEASVAPNNPTNTAPEPVKEKEVNDAKPSVNENDVNLHKIVSPMVGTFYSAPSPEEDDYVQVGGKVKTDSIVCIVEAMKLFNEIEAEIQGEVVEVLVENGQLVEYGQPLFLVKPE